MKSPAITKKRDTSDPPMIVNHDDDDALEILIKEYDVLRDLYSKAESSGQGMFNFYLTLLSSIVGAVVLIIQFSGADLRGTYFTLFALLAFAFGIGTIYHSAVTSRYGHMSRYARAIDALRLVLLQRGKKLLPPLYDSFIARSQASYRADLRLKPRLIWLLPLGSFQFFIALLNSAALAGSAWFLLAWMRVAEAEPIRTAVATFIILIVAFNVYNISAHLVHHTIMQRLNVDLYAGEQLKFLAGKD